MAQVKQLADDHFAIEVGEYHVEAKSCRRSRGSVDATVKVTASGSTQALERLTLTRSKSRREFLADLATRGHTLDEHVLILLDNAADGCLPSESAARDDDEIAKDTGQGQAIVYEDVEPWPDEVKLATVLSQMYEILTRYVVLTDAAAVATVLWCAHTYLMAAWETSPFLTVNSPVKQCGKTTLLRIIQRFVRRAQVTSSITEAALYRLIAMASPTLMLDEAENSIENTKHALYGVLNAGHTKDTAKTIRTVGDEHEPREFSTWAPKVVALIGKLKDTLMDRSIVIPMRRRRASEAVAKLRQRELRLVERDCLPIQQQLTRWAADMTEDCIECAPALPDSMRDRVADNWEPLFTIAHLAGGDWLTRAHRAAADLTGEESIENSAGMALLRGCLDIFEREGGDTIRSSQLRDFLNKIEPWKDAHGGKGISTTFLANKLKPFDILPGGTLRFGDDTAKGYRWACFVDQWERYHKEDWARYLERKPSQGNTTNDHGHESPAHDPSRPENVTGSEMSISPITTGFVTSVTTPTPKSARGHSAERF